MLSTNLSMNEVPKITDMAKLRTTPKNTLTLEPPTLTRSVIGPTTLNFWFVALFKVGRSFVCTALSHSASRRSSRIMLGYSQVSRTQLTRCIFLATKPTENGTFRCLLLKTRMLPIFSSRCILL